MYGRPRSRDRRGTKTFRSEEFWERKVADWRIEEQQLKLALDALANAGTEDRALSAERTLELANKAYSLYVSQDSFEKDKLLRMLLSNCSMDALSAKPAYRYPFDLIFKRAKMGEMVGTTRFELATSPTPRVRSTRLSHVPTFTTCAGSPSPRGVPSVYHPTPEVNLHSCA